MTVFVHRISAIAMPILHANGNTSAFLETGRIQFRRVRLQTPSSVSFFGPHRAPEKELSEFLSAYYLRVKANSPSFLAELTEFAAEFSELSLLTQYSQNSLPSDSHISHIWQLSCFRVEHNNHIKGEHDRKAKLQARKRHTDIPSH